MPPLSFPSTQPGAIHLTWEYPKPALVNYQLTKLEWAWEDPLALAIELKWLAAEDVEERFLSETDPEGSHWEELVRPAKDQVGILRLTEKMFEAASNPRNFQATGEGVFFNTSNLPRYWAFHEQPEGEFGQRIPRRAFVGVSREFQDKMLVVAENWLDTVLDDVVDIGGGGGGGWLGMMDYGASWGKSAAGAEVFGIPLGGRGFVPVGRGYGGMFVSLKGY